MTKPDHNTVLQAVIKKEFETQGLFARAIDDSDCKVSRVIHGWENIPKAEQKRWAKALGSKRKFLFA